MYVCTAENIYVFEERITRSFVLTTGCRFSWVDEQVGLFDLGFLDLTCVVHCSRVYIYRASNERVDF